MRNITQGLISGSFANKVALSGLSNADKTIYGHAFADLINQTADYLRDHPRNLAIILLILHDKCQLGKSSPYWTLDAFKEGNIANIKEDIGIEAHDNISRMIARFNAVATMNALFANDIKPTDNSKNEFDQEGKKELREKLKALLGEAISKLKSGNEGAFKDAKQELNKSAKQAKTQLPSTSIFSYFCSCLRPITQENNQSSPRI